MTVKLAASDKYNSYAIAAMMCVDLGRHLSKRKTTQANDHWDRSVLWQF